MERRKFFLQRSNRTGHSLQRFAEHRQRGGLSCLFTTYRATRIEISFLKDCALIPTFSRFVRLLSLSLSLLCAFLVAEQSNPTKWSVSPNHRYLVDPGGKPFFAQGDAAWSLIANLTDDQADEYLGNRHAKGFNTLLVNLIEHKFSKHPPFDLAGEPPFTDMDDWSIRTRNTLRTLIE